jgi:hypothetical protein
MKRIVWFFLMTSLSAFAANVSGVWKVDGSIEDHPITPTCTLKQADNKITGTCTTLDADHTADVTGEVKEKQLTWRYKVEYQGTAYTLTYVGTLDSDASIKGSVSADPSDTDGDFVAKKQ